MRELALDDHVGLREALLEVAALELEVAGDVALDAGVGAAAEALGQRAGRHLLVQQRRVFGCIASRAVSTTGSELVLHLDQRQRLLGDVRAGRRDGRDGVALVERLAAGASRFSASMRSLPIVSPKSIASLLDDREVRAAVTTALTPGSASRLAGVDRADARVGVGAAQDLAVQQPRQQISAPYRARPVTLSRPSWRIGRVPTTLNSRAVAVSRSAVVVMGFPLSGLSAWLRSALFYGGYDMNGRPGSKMPARERPADDAHRFDLGHPPPGGDPFPRPARFQLRRLLYRPRPDPARGRYRSPFRAGLAGAVRSRAGPHRGNNDHFDDPRLLDEQYLEVDGWRLGMAHILTPENRPLPAIQQRCFDRPLDILVGGHTHREQLRQDGGMLLVNSGSAVLPHHKRTRLGTVALLELDQDRLRAEIVVLGETAGRPNPGRRRRCGSPGSTLPPCRTPSCEGYGVLAGVGPGPGGGEAVASRRAPGLPLPGVGLPGGPPDVSSPTPLMALTTLSRSPTSEKSTAIRLGNWPAQLHAALDAPHQEVVRVDRRGFGRRRRLAGDPVVDEEQRRCRGAPVRSAARVGLQVGGRAKGVRGVLEDVEARLVPARMRRRTLVLRKHKHPLIEVDHLAQRRPGRTRGVCVHAVDQSGANEGILGVGRADVVAEEEHDHFVRIVVQEAVDVVEGVVHVDGAQLAEAMAEIRLGVRVCRRGADALLQPLDGRLALRAEVCSQLLVLLLSSPG